MIAKLMTEVNKEDTPLAKHLWFYCPACKAPVGLPVEKLDPAYNEEPFWDWNGDLEKPTLNPSILTRHGDGRSCHSFIKDGKIQFLSDCTHELAGQTVDLPELPEWLAKEAADEPAES